MGAKLNTAGKTVAYVYAFIALIVALASLVAGAQSIKEKREREAMNYFGFATFVALIVFMYVFIARKKMWRRALFG